MRIYRRDIKRKCEWLDKDNNIFNEHYVRETTLFGIIKWHYVFELKNDMSRLSCDRIIVSGLKNGKDGNKKSI